MVLVLKKGATKEEMQIIREKLQKSPSKKGVNLKKYVGILHVAEDPLTIQQNLRNETY
jgi:hypothetical protein